MNSIQIQAGDDQKSIYKRYKRFCNKGELLPPDDFFVLLSTGIFLGHTPQMQLEQYVSRNRFALEKAETRRIGKHFDDNFDDLVEQLGKNPKALDNYRSWIEFSCPDRMAEKINRQSSEGKSLIEVAVEMKDRALLKKLVDLGGVHQFKEEAKGNLIRSIQPGDSVKERSAVDIDLGVAWEYRLSKEKLEAYLFTHLDYPIDARTNAATSSAIVGYVSHSPFKPIVFDFFRNKAKNNVNWVEVGQPANIIEVLTSRKDVDVNKTDENGDTLLHKAVRKQNDGAMMGLVFHALLKHGARHIPNKDGKLPEELCSNHVWANALRETRIEAENRLGKAHEISGTRARSRISSDYIAEQSDNSVKLQSGSPRPGG